MYKWITSFAIIAVAFLIYPLSLSSQNTFSLSLDANSAAGDQAVTSGNISANEVVAIQIFGTDIQNANGVFIRFEYDESQVIYDGFDAGDILPNVTILSVESGTNPTFVQISLGTLGGQATSNTGLVGTIRFRTTAAFSGTSIRLVRGELGRGGQFERVTLNVSVELQSGPAALTPDFDGDGMVGFADFVQFAGLFGSSRGDGKYQARYDLDSDGAIGFSDFVLFANGFGKSVSPSVGGGSGGSGGGGGGGGGGTPPPSTPGPFVLAGDNGEPRGITYANNRFYVVNDDNDNSKVYVYMSGGQRDAASDFNLDSENSNPNGITYANNRFYVVNVWVDDKVYVYTSDGQRDAALDFNLHFNNGEPGGIMYANNRFYVVDVNVDKVYVYTSDGQHDAALGFDLHDDNSRPTGIAYANNRFYVVDSSDDKVYVYTSGGQRDADSDFSLDDDNSSPDGIMYANNRFYVVDDRDAKVYVYTSDGTSTSGGSGSSGSSGSPDLIVESPSVSDTTLTSGQSFTLHAAVRNQGTGQSASTTLRYYYRSSNSTNWTEVGTDSVSGLSASGTSAEAISLNAPSSSGTYYYGACVTSVAGESDTDNNCSMVVQVTVSSVSFALDLDRSYLLGGITYANNRFYVADLDKVYAYTSGGQRDAASDFSLGESRSLTGITYANNRFYVVDVWDDKVYAYTSGGQRDAASDFILAGDNDSPWGITYANNRFYVVDGLDDKVYVYTSDGQRDAASDFALDGENSFPHGITYANNRFYVVDLLDDKVYVYMSGGQRDTASDFLLDGDNGDPHGITYANNRFYVVDDSDEKVYVYTR